MFSIVIPTYNNLKYVKLCIDSIKKNSSLKHEIIVHSNIGSDGTNDYLLRNNIKHTISKENIGLCSGINKAAKLSTTNYILYSHDDMYFCPGWDKYLLDEVKTIGHEKFYLSGTMIQPLGGSHITLNSGVDIDSFDENKLLNNYKDYNYFDHQGSHFAPHLVTKKIWNLVGGFSEEFNPAIGSDPDFNMKLWNNGVRIFKGINNFKVYHFGGQTTRKKKDILFKKNQGSRANKIFLLKWGFSIKFFKKYYLKSNTRYVSQLNGPNKNIYYYKDLLINKLYYYVIKITKK
tara:strand:- start:542 stop:1408 length:867 start_codon:yes stop_codon:yes gene_type:complete